MLRRLLGDLVRGGLRLLAMRMVYRALWLLCMGTIHRSLRFLHRGAVSRNLRLLRMRPSRLGGARLGFGLPGWGNERHSWSGTLSSGPLSDVKARNVLFAMPSFRKNARTRPTWSSTTLSPP